jgi:serine protease
MNRFLGRAAVLAALVLSMGCDDEPTGPRASSAINLVPGQQITGISGGANSQRLYKVVVPAGAAALTVGTEGGSGDVDLLVRRGRVPTLLQSEWESFNNGNEDGVVISNPAAGDYYVLLYGSGDDGYSGVTLMALLTSPPSAQLRPALATGR